YRLFLEKRLYARQFLFRLDKPGLSLGDSGLATEIDGLEWHRVDEVQAVIFFDVPTFRKKNFFDDPGYLRTNFHRAKRLRLPDKLRLIRYRFSGYRNDFHLRNGRRRRGRLLGASGKQNDG